MAGAAERGRTLREAIREFTDPELLTQYDDLARQTRGKRVVFRSEWVEGPQVGAENRRSAAILGMRRRMRSLENQMAAALRHALQSGELVAVGLFVKPRLSEVRERVPAPHWEFLDFRLTDSSAGSDDVSIRSIRVYRKGELGDDVERYSTGLPGRRTTRHLIEAEFARRAEAGLVEATLAAEARALCAWISKAHPEAPRPSAGTIENHIRAAFRGARGKPTKPPTK